MCSGFVAWATVKLRALWHGLLQHWGYLTKECFSAMVPCKMGKNWWNERTLTSRTLKTLLQNIVKHIYCDSLFTLWFFPLSRIETFCSFPCYNHVISSEYYDEIHLSSAWFTHTQKFSCATLFFFSSEEQKKKRQGKKKYLHISFSQLGFEIKMTDLVIKSSY